MKVMAKKNQQQVWDAVSSSRKQLAQRVDAIRGTTSGVAPNVGPGEVPVTIETPLIETTVGQIKVTNTFAYAFGSSYADIHELDFVKQQVDSIIGPMQKAYTSVIKQLRNQNAVGVVVAVKGHIVWADMFASSSLLGKYWPKLLESYATEALTAQGTREEVGIQQAQVFLENWQARHEVVDSEPGLYRQRELVGDKFRAFQLTSLLAKEAFDVHLSKMAD
jgi:hypothetical protein